MNRTIAGLAVLVAACGASAQSVTTAFTYQGRVDTNGQPVSGVYDLRFRLYTAAGVQVGSTLCADNVTVSNGTFTTSLDFGSVFDGQQRQLEIDVRPDTGLGCGVTTGFATLSPRQSIVATPYAMLALNASTLGGQASTFFTNAANLTAGTIPDARLAATVARTNVNQTFSGAMTFTSPSNSFAGAGSGLTGLNASAIASGTVPDARLSTNVARLDLANTFAQNNTILGSLGIGAAPTNPLSISTTAQFVAQLTSSHLQGTGLTLVNTSTNGRAWNLVSGGVNNAEGPGTFFIRDATASTVRLIIDTSGNLGLGTITPGERLEVAGADSTVRIRNTNDTGGGFVLDTFSTLQLGLYNPSAAPWGNIPAATKRSLFGMQNTGRVGTLTNVSGSPIFRNTIDDGNGNASFAGSVAATQASATGGAVAGTHSGTFSNQYGVLGLASNTGASNAVGVRGESRGATGTGVFGEATATGTQAYGVIGVGHSTNTFSAGVYGESSDGNGVYGYSSFNKAVYGRSDGAYGVYAQTTTGGIALYGVRTSNNNRGWFGGASEGGWAESPTGIGFVAKTTTGGSALYAERNPGGTTPNVNRGWFGGAGEGAWAESDQGNGLTALSRGQNASAIYCRNDAGGRALFADGVAAVRALDILGGADLAEPFDLSTDEHTEPGMILVIDPDHAGRLRLSREAYDTKVAGIISGANGLSPGMVMRDENGSLANGTHPVAMTGRVWCYADASTSEIRPGDRLTTSDTPGHAMRAADPALAPGSVIGKAMTPLAKGEKGLVLVLVNLQ